MNLTISLILRLNTRELMNLLFTFLAIIYLDALKK